MPDIVILIIVSTRCGLSPDIYNSISMFHDSSLHRYQFQCQVYCEILKIVIRVFHVPSLHQELVRVRCIEDLSIPERSQPDILPDIVFLIIVSWRFISPFKFAPFESRVRCIEEPSIGRLEAFQWKFQSSTAVERFHLGEISTSHCLLRCVCSNLRKTELRNVKI